MIEEIKKLTEWISDIKADEVKTGRLPEGFEPSLRTLVARFNSTRGRQRGIYVHASYIWDINIAVLVSVTSEYHEQEKSDINYANEWKKKIPTNFH